MYFVSMSSSGLRATLIVGGLLASLAPAARAQPVVADADAVQGADRLYFAGQPLESYELLRAHLAVDSTEAAEKIYAALAEGGEVGMPIAETFFATRFAQLRDRFGTLWTILHERPR